MYCVEVERNGYEHSRAAEMNEEENATCGGKLASTKQPTYKINQRCAYMHHVRRTYSIL